MKLQTKSGIEVFEGKVLVNAKDFTLVKEDDKVYAEKNGKRLGLAHTVLADGKKIAVENLVPSIDPADLVGKDPTTLSKDELVVLTQYLQNLTAGKLNVSDKKEAKKKAEKAVEEKTGKKVEEEEEAALPEGIESIADLEDMGAKELWKEIVKPIADQLDGINSRSKKDEMIAAIAEFYDLEDTEADEDDEDLEEDDLPEDLDDSEEESDEDIEEDEDLEEDSDEEEEEESEYDEDEDSEEEDDSEEEEEEEEDEDDYEEDDEEEEDNEDSELTPEDIDNLETKEEIVAIIKKYDLDLPKKKLSVRKVKEFIKNEIFGDE